jgi:hypothetical protein
MTRDFFIFYIFKIFRFGPLIYVPVQNRLISVPCLEGHHFAKKIVPSNFINNENVYFSLFPP